MEPNFKLNKAAFITKASSSNIHDDYDFNKALGEGAYGVVYLATEKRTNERRAIKVITKDKLSDPESFINETAILKTMDHPNIIKLFEIYETPRLFYLVTEVCEGGELFYYIKKMKSVTEDQAAKIMRQIFAAVSYCHAHKVCHRDLKPENFLLKYENDISSIKLIDFGLSKRLREDEIIASPEGTPFYVAPEVLKGAYTEKADNWSLGVILYILLCGSPPFFGKTTRDILLAVQKGEFSMTHKAFQTCSPEVKDLISKLIVKDPVRRYTSQQAYNHPWIQREVAAEVRDLAIDTSLLTNLNNFIEAQTLKKSMMMFIAQQVPEKEVENLKAIFTKMDVNGDGSLSEEEFIAGMTNFSTQLGVSVKTEDLKKLFRAIDMDASTSIDYTEFLSCFMENLIYKNEKYLRAMFEKFDLDKSGKISAEELRTVLSGDDFNLPKDEVERMIRQADSNGDGEIDYNEIVQLLTRSRTV
eukprot:TRINITY_DN539_c0_g1_i11.p1 TRINITY_DN539_c0_g1~~TRINITY_DN539_c0_g1_i11.p1  ORF type:complete len:472 (-),score=153.12 TRINITY_DN539_c0_g1_i11:130-1545(-)